MSITPNNSIQASVNKSQPSIKDFEDASDMSKLPVELLHEIFSSLSSLELKQVSKKWKYIIDHSPNFPLRALLECKHPLKILPYSRIKIDDGRYERIKGIGKNPFFQLGDDFFWCRGGGFRLRLTKSKQKKTNQIKDVDDVNFSSNNFYWIGDRGLYQYKPRNNRTILLKKVSDKRNYIMGVSDNGERIAYTGLSIQDNTVNIYNTQSKKNVKISDFRELALKYGLIFAGEILAVHYKLKGIGGIGWSNNLVVYNSNGRELKELKFPGIRLIDMTASKDHLAVDLEEKIVVYDPPTLEKQYEIENNVLGRNQPHYYAKKLKIFPKLKIFTIENNCLYTLSESNIFKIFDATNGKEIKSFAIVETPDSCLMKSGFLVLGKSFENKNWLELWDVNNGKLLGEIEAKEKINLISLNQRENGLLELAALSGQEIQIWSPRIELNHLIKERKEKKEEE